MIDFLIAALVGATVAGIVAASSSGGASGATIEPKKGGTMSPKMKLWTMLRALPQLTEDQRLFLVLVAHGETGGTYRPTAHNDTASEVAASRAAWRNSPSLAQRLTACGAGGEDAWAIGSGGYGGRLVPYFGDDLLDAGLPCAPRKVFEPRFSLVSAIITAHKLQQLEAWQSSARTVANLRAGYYGLAYIRNPPADRVEKYRHHAVAAGLPQDFIARVLPEFPGPDQGRAMMDILNRTGI